MKKTLFIKNAAILTFTSFLLRFAGIIFKVWLAALVGSEGIGLYQLIFSVYLLVSTFASSGISTAVTRLVSEELAVGSKTGVLKIMRRAIILSLGIAATTVVIVFFGSNFIATTLLSDARAAISIRILPFSLPFMAISSCLKGYFIAARRVTPTAASNLTEQAVRILLVLLLVRYLKGYGLDMLCAAVMLGDVVSEAVGFALVYIIYLKHKKTLFTLSGRTALPYKAGRKIIKLALPITSGRYLNTALRTAENLLVPKNLARYPHATSSALSQFGMIKGMALPVLFFPSAILNSVSTLLIPEMSEAVAVGRKNLVKYATENILRLTSVVSYIFSAIFLLSGEKIGLVVYKDSSVGFLLTALAPIVPFMYLDSISDGILKGLDQQSFCFRTSVSDSVIRICLILTLLPLTGLNGFIGIMYFSNFLTCFLNVSRLLKISGASLKFFNDILFPITTACLTTLTFRLILGFFSINNNLIYIILLSGVCLPAYFIILLIFKIITVDSIKNILK